MVNVLLLVLLAGDVTCFLILPFLMVSYWRVAVVVLVMLLLIPVFIGTSLIPLFWLLLQLLIKLGELLDYSSEGLHLPLQSVRRVSNFLVDGSH